MATVLVVFYASRWRSCRRSLPALWVLAVSLLGATLLHTDKFKFGYPPTWLWIAVYATVPFGIPILVDPAAAQGRSAAPERDPALNGVRVASLVIGNAIAIWCVALFVEPTQVGKHWPWHLTPLFAQVVACWYGMIAVALIACGIGLRDRSEAFIPYATLAAWSILVLALAAAVSGRRQHERHHLLHLAGRDGGPVGPRGGGPGSRGTRPAIRSALR